MNVGEGGCACFWLEPTGMVRLSLRRFTFALAEGEEETVAHRNCPERDWGHEAGVTLDVEIPAVRERQPEGYEVMSTVPQARRPPRDDPRWPTVCEACAAPFRPDDVWQVNQQEVYVRSDNGERVAIPHYPGREFAGALFDAWWRHGYVVRDKQGNERGYVGPDGIALMAVCPNGHPWEVDGPATGGGGWTRTGDPRRPETLTVTPSILVGDYHGFITAGRFTAHIG